MHSINTNTNNVLSTTVRTLNQPFIKEGIKNVVGSITFAFGVIELCDLYQLFRGREITTETYSNQPQWIQVANKVSIVCAKISLVLSAGVSRPGIFIISSTIGSMFSSRQLEKLFGPNTIFAINPYHPRHVASIVAVVLALPTLGQSIYLGTRWVYNKTQMNRSDTSSTSSGLTDNKVRSMNVFNALTSRPVLHLGNQLNKCVL